MSSDRMPPVGARVRITGHRHPSCGRTGFVIDDGVTPPSAFDVLIDLEGTPGSCYAQRFDLELVGPREVAVCECGHAHEITLDAGQVQFVACAECDCAEFTVDTDPL